LGIGGLALVAWIFFKSSHNEDRQKEASPSNNSETGMAHSLASDLEVPPTNNLPTPRVIVVVPPPLTNGNVATTNLFKTTVNTNAGFTKVTSKTGPLVTVLEAQIALARRGISPGSLDGALGSQTRSALRAYQASMNLPVTGSLDSATKSVLEVVQPIFKKVIVTQDDLDRLQPVGTNWLSKSQQSRLDYETILELESEKAWSHPLLIKKLNSGIDWSNVVAGTELVVPNVEKPMLKSKIKSIHIKLQEKILEGFDENTNLLVHFPCSIAQKVEKRPVGELHVMVLAPNPNYTFDPEVFPESEEARQMKTKLLIPPGPNNPVGSAWIGLDKPGYGMHGTPKPEEVGRTESHGCFRLSNWNAELLVRYVSVGVPVYVEP
ncbi:MAG: ErfK/YbiS/YcfS/YnhG family protein, partial [Verrucomicrobiales bacterium]|nr:ErfK/YbiS/YcfS/YnhG family protein [Verrucomicrobiales bacterium]